ncbi:hypothetical protein M3Y94_01139000 [Aphelenchoides besseyi]|nr:hypothetical protein M3Y94_01139000 [Aphelenchoides besseyi]KAI6227846.1 hypothetical protein M3Y95_00559600 [Aphelenchoides besseyi]
MSDIRRLWLTVLLVHYFVSLAACYSECTHGVDAKRLLPLSTYVNDFTGLYHDHFSTTWNFESHPTALSRYTQIQRLGLVLKHKQQEECDCAVQVIQLYDEQLGIGGTTEKPGLFGRLNHKLVLRSKRPDDAIDSYFLTGERFYCAPKFGQCGASIPLTEWQHVGEDDTIFTSNKSMKNELGIVKKGVLCYIWPLDYKSDSLAQQISESDEQTSVNTKEFLSVRVNQCQRLETKNGEWSQSTLTPTVGTTSKLTCLPGYWPNSNVTYSVCQRSGKWLPPPMSKCICIGCPAFPSTYRVGQIAYSVDGILPNENIKSKDSYPVGTKASLLCPENTEVSQQSADTAVCTESGWVPSALGSCERVCPPLNLTNGFVVYTDSQGFDRSIFSNGTIATGVCIENAKLNGNAIAICVDGKWTTEELGSCDLPTCPPLEDVGQDGRLFQLRHGNTTSNLPKKFYSGTTIRLQCNRDKKIVGATETKCDASGFWQPSLGKCQ